MELLNELILYIAKNFTYDDVVQHSREILEQVWYEATCNNINWIKE